LTVRLRKRASLAFVDANVLVGCSITTNVRRRHADFRFGAGVGHYGLPYQTLISSLLHKYASGRLKDV
jgi:hypothetical protein